MVNLRLKTVLALALVALSAVVLDAQLRDIRGRVLDASGAVMPGVTVELVRDGQVVKTATTSEDGEFRLSIVDLAQGRFEIRVSAAGFAAASLPLSSDTGSKTVTAGNFTVEVRATRPATAAARPPAPPPPTAAPPTGGEPSPAPNENHAIVPVFYATDRNRVTYTPLSYGGDREPTKQLHLGRIDVSVPRDHKEGQVERPSIWTFWREDPNKHFIIVRGTEQAYDEFYAQIRGVVEKSSRKEAFVFVHGFNVSFESAVYRTAQIAYDLGFDGAPILYSWPSLGTATGYPTDANNSEWTIDRLHWFLEDVAEKTGASYIHVIAHSRGNWPMMRALNAIATEPRNAPRPHFRQIVFTAPDVDADTFKLLAQGVRTIGDRTTLYASANDEALALSKTYQGYQRAGDVRPEIVIVPGVDSIDVSAVDTSLLGHSYYGDNTSVISDIARLLRSGLPPEKRCGLQSMANAALRYWTFVAHSVCPAIGIVDKPHPPTR